MVRLVSRRRHDDRDDLTARLLVLRELLLVSVIKTLEEHLVELWRLLQVEVQVEQNADERYLRIHDDIVRVQRQHDLVKLGTAEHFTNPLERSDVL